MLERQRELGASQPVRTDGGQSGVVNVGILTRGKATLGITLTSLLLQDTSDIRIHILDTSDAPVVNRDDVTLAMRMAFDRQIHCSYERLREKKRGFSLGRVRLLERLSGPYACFVDDDMALSATVLSSMLRKARLLQQPLGCISPVCVNATSPMGESCDGSGRYTPGSLFYLDEPLRELLVKYYSSTTDIVDSAKAGDKVWEVAFLSEIFRQLDRPCLQEPAAVIYHLDYHELQNWYLTEGTIISRSVALVKSVIAPRSARAVAS
jgi:hypothetical protein